MCHSYMFFFPTVRLSKTSFAIMYCMIPHVSMSAQTNSPFCKNPPLRPGGLYYGTFVDMSTKVTWPYGVLRACSLLQCSVLSSKSPTSVNHGSQFATAVSELN